MRLSRRDGAAMEGPSQCRQLKSVNNCIIKTHFYPSVKSFYFLDVYLHISVILTCSILIALFVGET